MRNIIITFAILLSALSLSAQTSKEVKPKFITWQAFAGLNFGATSPVPVPKGITKVYAWYPNTNPSVGITGIHKFNGSKHHGIGFSLQAERKSFKATTKLENLEVGDASQYEQDSETISGNQQTSFSARYISLPIFYVASLAKNKVNLYVGSYASLLLGTEFKIVMDTDPETLDDSTFQRLSMDDYVRPYEIGFIFGTDYFFNNNLGATLRFTAGITSATKDEFANIGYSLHNLYALLGITYKFQ